MILSIDHIALCSDNIERDEATILEFGYSNVFHLKEIKNPSIKRDLLSSNHAMHDLSLYTRDNSIAIELINHHSQRETASFIIPVFTNVREDQVEVISMEGPFASAVLKKSHTPIYLKQEDTRPGIHINTFCVNTNDINSSIIFWQNFGFKCSNKSLRSQVMEFYSPIKREIITMRLNESKEKIEHYLDDTGFNCIAFITNSVERERAGFEEKGFNVTEIEPFVIADRHLRIFFARGHNSELVELIEFIPLRER
jgi:hypothetical protein